MKRSLLLPSMLVALIVLSLSISTLLPYVTPMLNEVRNGSGVVLSLRFIPSTSMLSERVGNVKQIYVEVHIASASGPMTTVYRGPLATYMIGLSYSTNEAFRRVVDSWCRLLASRNELDSIRRTEGRGIIVDVYVVGSKGVLHLMGGTTFHPWRICRGELEILNVVLDVRSAELICIPGKDRKGLEPLDGSIGPIDIHTEKVWYLGPENLSSQVIPTIVIGGRKYVEMPIFVVRNELAHSAVVGFSIVIVNAYKLRIPFVVATGSSIDNAYGDLAEVSIELYKLDASAFEVYTSFYEYYAAQPQQSTYVYIYARPYAEYWVTYVGDDPLLKRLVLYVNDIAIYGATILGGAKVGEPPSIVTQYFFNDNATEEVRPYVPGTPLEDGKLDPGEGVALSHIFNFFDTCNAGFEISIPVGPILAAVCEVATEGACTPFVPVLAAIPLSLELGTESESSIYINGGLQNCGDGSYCNYPPIPNAYNTFEWIHFRISKLKFVKGSCIYRVPIAFYVIAR